MFDSDNEYYLEADKIDDDDIRIDASIFPVIIAVLMSLIIQAAAMYGGMCQIRISF